MSDIVWEDPPRLIGGSRRRSDWPARFALLVAEPKRWARIAEFSSSLKASQWATNTRRLQSRFPAGSDLSQWELTARKQPDGTGAVYARYLGPLS